MTPEEKRERRELQDEIRRLSKELLDLKRRMRRSVNALVGRTEPRRKHGQSESYIKRLDKLDRFS